MKSLRDYPLGLTAKELEQRAWVEGDRDTSTLLQIGAVLGHQDARGVPLAEQLRMTQGDLGLDATN